MLGFGEHRPGLLSSTVLQIIDSVAIALGQGGSLTQARWVAMRGRIASRLTGPGAGVDGVPDRRVPNLQFMDVILSVLCLYNR